MTALTFTPAEVYTMTCTCRSGVEIDDLEELAADVVISTGASPGVVYCKSPSGVERGDVPVKQRVLKRAFGRQITFRVRVPQQERLVHLKMFSNGTIQTTGALDEDTAYSAAGLACTACGIDASPVDLAVRMINCGFKASRRLNLVACFHAARAAGMAVSYDPCCYSALKISLFFPQDGVGHACKCATNCMTKKPRHRWCQMVTVSVFESGSVGVSGGVTHEELERAATLVRGVLKDGVEVVQADEDQIRSRLQALALGLKGSGL